MSRPSRLWAPIAAQFHACVADRANQGVKDATPTCSDAAVIYMTVITPQSAINRKERSVSSFVRRRSVLRLATGAAAIALAGPGLAVMASRQAMAEQDPAAQLVQRGGGPGDRGRQDQRRRSARGRHQAGARGPFRPRLHGPLDAGQLLEPGHSRATPALPRGLGKRGGARLCRALRSIPRPDADGGPHQSRGNGVSIVDSKLNQSDGDPVAVQWEVRNEGQGPRIVDVKTEGVSMNHDQAGGFRFLHPQSRRPGRSADRRAGSPCQAANHRAATASMTTPEA